MRIMLFDDLNGTYRLRAEMRTNADFSALAALSLIATPEKIAGRIGPDTAPLLRPLGLGLAMFAVAVLAIATPATVPLRLAMIVQPGPAAGWLREVAPGAKGLLEGALHEVVRVPAAAAQPPRVGGDVLDVGQRQGGKLVPVHGQQGLTVNDGAGTAMVPSKMWTRAFS
ncbi:MAG: hypothetical protein SF187_02285 [Deltaproteobacteria bacterium]|nr:hypothetical protein [Deltaproteobacteria bacterium]